jgi:hypothetical protein
MLLVTYFLYLIIIYKKIVLLDVIFFNYVIKWTEFIEFSKINDPNLMYFLWFIWWSAYLVDIYFPAIFPSETKFNVDIYYQEKDLINSGNKVKND